MRLELGKEYRPDALVREMVVRRPDQPDHALSSETGILEIFEQSGRSLLILGEPGSGKTFTLLELARDLLDGFDEVDAAYREECTEALNSFFAEHLAGIALCSRQAEYEQLPQQLNLGEAIVIQPLDETQVSRFLEETGLDEVAAVRETAAGMRKLTDSPLILNMMALAYRDLEPGDLAGLDAPAAFRRHLFRTYTERMFYHRYRAPQFPPDKARGWLRWLARRMVEHDQSIFDPFRMQPGWLDAAGERRYWLGMGALGGLLAGAVTGSVMLFWNVFLPVPFAAAPLFGLLAFLPLVHPGWRPLLEKYEGPIFGPVGGLVVAPAADLVGGLLGGVAGILADSMCRRWLSICTWRRTAVGLTTGLLVGLITGLEMGLVLGLASGLLGSLIGAMLGAPPPLPALTRSPSRRPAPSLIRLPRGDGRHPPLAPGRRRVHLHPPSLHGVPG